MLLRACIRMTATWFCIATLFFPLTIKGGEQMATSEEVQQFWDTMSPYCQAEYTARENKLLVSVALGQGAYESGYGTSYLATACNNCYGIRAYSSWTGAIYDRGAGTIYSSYAERQTDDCFKVYDSKAGSVTDYYELITTAERYAGAVNNPSYRSALEYIIAGGYTQSETYVDTVCYIIESFNLTQYDTFTPPPVSNEIQIGDIVTATRIYQLGNFFLNPKLDLKGKTLTVISMNCDNVKAVYNNIAYSVPKNILKKL